MGYNQFLDNDNDLYGTDVSEQPQQHVWNPLVKSYLQDKYASNLGSGDQGALALNPESASISAPQQQPYDDASRQKIVDENNQYDTAGAIQGALASLGAAFQGKDSLAAVGNVIAQRNKDRENRIAEFDKGRTGKVNQDLLGIQQAKQKREDSKYAMDESQRIRENDINSDESKTAQQAALAMGVPPETAKKMTATQFKIQGPIIEKINQSKLSAQTRGDTMKERNMQFQERMGEKKSAEVDKLAKDFKNDMDADKGRSGNFGLISGKVQSAERLQTLIDAYKDGNLPPAQMEELALGLSNMLAPGGGGSRAQVEALVPHSIIGDTQKLKSYLFNEPMGANQQKFVNMMKDTVNRERDTARNQLNQIRTSRLPAHKKYQTLDPEGYASQLQGYGVDPTNIKDGRYTPPMDDEHKQAVDWAMQNPNDPDAQKILQMNGVKVGGK